MSERQIPWMWSFCLRQGVLKMWSLKEAIRITWELVGCANSGGGAQWSVLVSGPPKDMSNWNLWMWPGLGYKFLADVLKVGIMRRSLPELGWALNPATGIFVRGEKGKGRTEENVSAVRGIGWNDASVNQGLSRLAGSSQKPGERH